MTVYIDGDYRCHTEPGEGRRPVETTFFDGKCDSFIEGYRFVPEGETWTRSDGQQFRGQMISPAVDYNQLECAQEQRNADVAALYTALTEGVNSI